MEAPRKRYKVTYEVESSGSWSDSTSTVGWQYLTENQPFMVYVPPGAVIEEVDLPYRLGDVLRSKYSRPEDQYTVTVLSGPYYDGSDGNTSYPRYLLRDSDGDHLIDTVDHLVKVVDAE